jgi:hypothetical protein
VLPGAAAAVAAAAARPIFHTAATVAIDIAAYAQQLAAGTDMERGGGAALAAFMATAGWQQQMANAANTLRKLLRAAALLDHVPRA